MANPKKKNPRVLPKVSRYFCQAEGWGRGGTESKVMQVCVCVSATYSQDNSPPKHRLSLSKSLLNVQESCFLQGRQDKATLSNKKLC